MDILRPLVWRPLKTASISPAAVFRTVEIAKPTLLIDEADAVFGRDGQPGQNEELRAILNSGHRQGDDVLRVEGDNHEVRMFATFAPVAIALIGKLPETLADRSITVSLKRRLPSETISGFRADRIDDLKSLARKAARWAEDNAGALMHSDPKIPDTVFNREADNWRPLFVIAAVAGGDWPRRVRKAALGPASAAEDEAYGIQLLTDIRDIFAERGLGDNDGMPSADLVAALIALPERSWGECNRGKAITQSGLAKRLSPFGIRTRDVHTGYGREGTRSFKGYAFKTLKEVFARYIPGFSTAQPRNGNLNNDLDGKSNRATANGCADGNSPNSLDLNELLGCADENGETGEREDIGAGDDCACAQCHGPIDGTEELVLGPDGEGVWLHPQCKRFYFGGRTAR
jgi:hypothetical protein